jgi:hypothetical protein
MTSATHVVPAVQSPSGTAMTDPPGYPRELERDVVLRDGAKVHVRPIGPDDVPRLVAAYARLSAHSAYQRFLLGDSSPPARLGPFPGHRRLPYATGAHCRAAGRWRHGTARRGAVRADP